MLPGTSLEHLDALPYAVRFSMIHIYYYSKGLETRWVNAKNNDRDGDAADPLGDELREMCEAVKKRLNG